MAKTCLILAAILVVLTTTTAYAQATDDAVDGILHLYRDHAAAWQGTLRTLALRLFWLLAGIEFTWGLSKLILKGADLSEFVAEMVNQIMVIGFGLMLLTNSATWATAVVDSFREAANQAVVASGGSPNLSPSNIFETGVGLALKILARGSVYHLGDSVALAIAGIVILICFALITAHLVMALIEMYIVISASVLLMGFAGSRWTREYAFKIFGYSVSVGAKLFLLQLLIGTGESMIQSWTTQDPATDSQVLVILGSSVILLIITKAVPDLVQGLINGGSFNTHGAGLLGGITAAAGGAAGAAIGAGAAIHGASALASEQRSSSSSSSSKPTSVLGKLAGHAGAMGKNMRSAAAEDIGARLGGRAFRGTMGGRMADNMHGQTKVMSADRNKPSPPTDKKPESGKSDNTIKPGDKS
jgi:type IV secretion system protein TrbL